MDFQIGFDPFDPALSIRTLRVHAGKMPALPGRADRSFSSEETRSLSFPVLTSFLSRTNSPKLLEATKSPVQPSPYFLYPRGSGCRGRTLFEASNFPDPCFKKRICRYQCSFLIKRSNCGSLRDFCCKSGAGGAVAQGGAPALPNKTYRRLRKKE
jgi:hypothetical protein